MAQSNSNARPFVNLDYFSIPPSPCPGETDHQRKTLSSLQTGDTSLASTGIICQPQQSSATPVSVNSSPSDHKSPYSNTWEASPNDELLVSGSQSCNSFAHSPSPPLTPLDVRSLTAFKSELDVTGRCFDSLSAPFNFDDWMSWDRNDYTDRAWSQRLLPKTEPQSLDMTGIEPAPQKSSEMTEPSQTLSVYTYDDSFSKQTSQQQPVKSARQSETLEANRGLYSTPLCWEPPKPGANYLPIAAVMNHDVAKEGAGFSINGRPPTLSTSQEAQLVNIAMPQLAQSNFMTKYARSDVSSSPSSPEAIASIYDRKSSSATDRSFASSSERGRRQRTTMKRGSDTKQSQQPVKKTAHNMIEKRYRTNLNDKISALRDSVPSLRVAARKDETEGQGEGDEDLEGLAPAHKLNKATVLSKATEYIAHLESRTRELTRDNEGMKRRIDAFEQLFEQQLMQQRQPTQAQDRDARDSQRMYHASATRA